MTKYAGPGPLSRGVTRFAVVGMALAVLALGALAVFSTTVTQTETDRLSQVGLQTAGQLRAMQAQNVIRTQTNALEDEVTPASLAKLRAAQAAFPQAVAQMEAGGAPAVIDVAKQVRVLLVDLAPAIERFLADLTNEAFQRTATEEQLEAAERAMDDILTELGILLNDSSSDPGAILSANLDNVAASAQTVRRTAFVLLPLGLLGVIACGWLLSSYRRRSDAIMRTALETMAREVRTDQLTTLPNRRGLLDEFERRAVSGQAFTLAIADLNGFKRYNDTFGHSAGDEMLRRLGNKLSLAWAGRGYASRLGGDEFCVLADDLTPHQLQAVLHEALTESGEGFDISAVFGLANVPTEVADANAALRLADTRLYAAKAEFHGTHGTSRPAAPPSGHRAPEPSSFSAVSMLDQQQPDLHHPSRMTELAVACAQAVGVPADQLATVECAAQLHDIGKVAIPAAILTKATALTDDERRFIRRHAAIGERLLAVNDTLEPVAEIVRAIHERWDGAGYPDQLVGEQIPIGGRVIAAVEAFHAMTRARPYAATRSVADAVAELRRCSGTQFDPAVVTALAEAVNRSEAQVPRVDMTNRPR